MRVGDFDRLAQPHDAGRVTGTKLVNPEVVAAAIRTPAGETLDVNLADENIKRIGARADFESVRHTLSTDPAGRRGATSC